MRLFLALRRRDFALLFAGQTVSRVGDFVYQIALAWWVLTKTGSAASMGTVMICSFAPMLVFFLVGGIAVDTRNRIAIMLVSDVIRGILVLVVAAMACAGRLEMWEICAVALAFGTADAFFNPAFAAVLPSLVEPQDLPSANALSSLSLQLGRIVGPALGSATIALLGIGAAFGLNGLSFLVAGACLLPLLRRSGATARANPAHAPPAPDSPAGATPTIAAGPIDPAAAHQPTPGFWQGTCAGLALVVGTPWLWLTILMFAIANVLIFGPYSVSLPFLVQRNLGTDVGTLALLYTMFPIGHAVAAVWFGRTGPVLRRGLVVYGGVAIAGVTLASLGTGAPLALLAVAAVINGFALEAASLAWTQTLQERVPNAMLGRVSSIDSLGSFALLPLAYAAAGWATDRVGAPAVFTAAGWATAGVALLGLLHPAVRGLIVPAESKLAPNRPPSAHSVPSTL